MKHSGGIGLVESETHRETKVEEEKKLCSDIVIAPFSEVLTTAELLRGRGRLIRSVQPQAANI